MDFGLERVGQVAAALGIRFDCPVITVGGTNGKGSTCAFLESILRQAGYRVGLHTSPHLVHFNERARIDGEPASDRLLTEHFELVEQARCSFAEPVSLTLFEFSLLGILLAFQHASLDVVILEVGLGGRLDAVNIIDADCAIVTSIDIDHARYLGNTRDAIALEKAHIYRAGRPAICSDPVPPQSLIDHAARTGADLWLNGRDFNVSGDKQQWAFGGRSKRIGGLAYPALRGVNQLLNAAGALAVIDAMRDRLPVSNQAIRAGFALVELPGRFQVLPGQPTVVLDVAHNPHAAATLANNLDNMGYHPYTHAVFGCMRDKDIEGIARHLVGRVDHWHIVNLPLSRAAETGLIESALRNAGYPDDKDHSITCHPDSGTAYDAVRAKAGTGDRIVVFGSFLTVGAVIEHLRASKPVPLAAS
jgi:dihydrofolate synthase/folylpolyglutamate synthase